MFYISGLMVLLVVAMSEARVGDSSLQEICTETKECLLYDLICEEDDYQVRHYGAVKWVSTEEEYFFLEVPAMMMFRRLYDYIRGANNMNATIEMTSPVLVKIKTKGIFQMAVYTMSFLLPSEYQINPPAPTDSKVYIQEMPAMKVYVRSYDELLMTHTDLQHSKALARSLKSAGAKFNGAFHYAAGYNSPMTLKKRHNEVWYVAEGEPACPVPLSAP